MKIQVNQMVKMAVLSALSIVLMVIIRFPIIPAAPYMEYEPADVPILIGAFLYGPLAGLIITFVVSFIQAVTFSAASGWVGFVMHMIATGTLVVVAGIIYKRIHTLKGAVIALIAGTLSMTIIMIPANLFFTVNFYGIPYDTVVKMLIPVIIPFNFIKAFINSLIVMVVYKSVGRILRGTVSSTIKTGQCDFNGPNI